MSRERWEAWVEAAFKEMVELAERLEYPVVVEVVLGA